MSDDARRLLTEEERARIYEAKNHGRTCGRCSRALADGEIIWMERVKIRGEYGGASFWRMPVGAECASPAFRAETEGAEPDRCAGCGRGMYYQAADLRRRSTICSRRCAAPVARARAKEAKGS